MTKIKTAAMAALLAACTLAGAQPATTYLGPLQGENHRQKGYAYQGMDAWGKTVVSLQNQGIATVYKRTEEGIAILGQFHLGSFHPYNHANVASFGPWKGACSDPLPLLYVSHCHKKSIQGFKDVCFVERIHPDYQGSTLVQTIVYDDLSGDFGYALQWVVDRKRKRLIGYGNTVNNSDPSNRHRVIVFRLPKPSDGETVILKKEDALENYTIEAVSEYRFNPIGQGLFVHNNQLYMPTGLGTAEHPSILYIWDLRAKKMREIPLGAVTTGELEDISFTKGRVLLQGQDGLWEIKANAL